MIVCVEVRVGEGAMVTGAVGCGVEVSEGAGVSLGGGVTGMGGDRVGTAAVGWPMAAAQAEKKPITATRMMKKAIRGLMNDLRRFFSMV